MNLFFKRWLTSCFLITLATFSACKKDKKISPDITGNGENTGGNNGATASRADLTRDSIFLYAKQVYYWNDALPEYNTFNPRKYTSLSADLSNFKQELFDISQIKINPATTKPYEFYNAAPGFSKYSYIDLKSETAVVASSPNIINSLDGNGNGDDYGIDYAGAYTGAQQTTYAMFIIYVTPSSPAARAGIHRGDVIVKVNNTAIGPNPNSYGYDLITLDDALTQPSATLQIVKSGQSSTTTIPLTKAKYTASPIFRDSVYTSGSTRIGYLAYSQFTSDANSGPALRNAFEKFATAGITDLVVDLRYNGGGFETSAILLSNLIAPSSVDGSVMFTEYFNTTMQNGAATLLRNQPLRDQAGKQRYDNGKPLYYSDVNYKPEANITWFKKEGTINNLRKVVFIGTGNTASASELVINNLKPYMDVKLVGETTYGKPIGFFPIYIDQYEVYYSMIGLKNSAGQGDYFAGFTPDHKADDYFNYDWGDTRDASLKAAISYILTGNYTSGFTVSKAPATFQAMSNRLRLTPRNNFKGLRIDKFPIKP
jgi:hypothetical protein